MPGTRELTVGDTDGVRRLLASRPFTTMFLRERLAREGLPLPGVETAPCWVGVFEGAPARQVGVVVHDEQERLVIDAPVWAAEAAVHVVGRSRRPVTGLIGPRDQVVAARRALGLAERATQLDTEEVLYALELAELCIPERLESGAVTCRRARSAHFDTLFDWRTAYEAEAVRAVETPELAAYRRERLHRGLGRGHVWILHEGDEPVSMCSFNAALPDSVQIGGVYTPPEHRSRRHAQAVVAGRCGWLAGRGSRERCSSRRPETQPRAPPTSGSATARWATTASCSSHPRGLA